MPRPRVHINCVAQAYAAPDERIVEVTGQDGIGCLVSITNRPDGTVSLYVYSRDQALTVAVAEARS